MFDVRWVFSSFQAVNTIWRDFPALRKHLSDSASSVTGKKKAKYSGLIKKMTTFTELALLKDCLRELKSLTLYFESRDAQISKCYCRIRNAHVTMKAIKDNYGRSYTKIISEFDLF